MGFVKTGNKVLVSTSLVTRLISIQLHFAVDLRSLFDMENTFGIW